MAKSRKYAREKDGKFAGTGGGKKAAPKKKKMSVAEKMTEYNKATGRPRDVTTGSKPTRHEEEKR